VPDRVAVPFPLSEKLTPVGSDPDSLRSGVGVPVVVTVKEPEEPSLKIVLLDEVMFGACSTEVTVSVKLWFAGLPTPLLAVKVIGKLPLDVGVPDKLAVPFPLSVKVTPAGSVPVSLRAGVGLPVVVTRKLPDTPLEKVVLDVEVMAGDWSTVRVNDCAAFGLIPLAALKVIE
jgi:hypothetical protein